MFSVSGVNDYFLNKVEILEIPENLDIINDTTDVNELIIKFSSHPSIKKIKEKFNVSKRFQFIPLVEEVRVKISELDEQKIKILFYNDGIDNTIPKHT